MADWLGTSVKGWQEFFGNYSHAKILYPPRAVSARITLLPINFVN